MVAASDFLPAQGQRALIVGQTGSGKTAFATFLLEHVEYVPIIIYDTKEEPKFTKLPNNVVVEEWSDVVEAVENPEIDFIVFRPSADVTSEPVALDELLHFHFNNFRGVAAYIDETYSFHIGGRPGKGLISLLTKGRSRGITTIMSTQRPSWISRFCLTESEKFYLFRLIDIQDRKRLGDVIPDFAKLPPLTGKPYYFYFYRTGEEQAQLYRPIKLRDGIDAGYIDVESEAANNIVRIPWI